MRGAAMGFLSEFWAFLSERKKFWLLPILLATGLVAGLTIVTKGSAIGPFLYVLF